MPWTSSSWRLLLSSSRLWYVVLVLNVCITDALAGGAPVGRVQFNRDIRPILSDKCFLCHGPDRASRKADLRLDLRTDALAAHDGGPAIVPGRSSDSELVRRIVSDDADEQMPPKASGQKISPREVELLKRWIDEGAEYQLHWSFIPPQRPPVPELTAPELTAPKLAAPESSAPKLRPGQGTLNAIDVFVRARLRTEGLEPAGETDKTTLLRRVTFDLTGLPPTPEEVDDFLADSSPSAYERVVDRLLNSPRYGERMATAWLDAARYADTNGYQSDEQRVMWRWRDWVIEAFNRNQPFDEFTIEQLAGDLLPNPRLDQLIATGFNRNHRANSEGGIIPEEFLVEYAVDRLDTTATVWLGLTIGCARCHDHKYDPITQKDFYRLLAFFNNVPEQGKVTRVGNPPPMIKAPTPEIEAESKRLDAALTTAANAWRDLAPQLAVAQAQWEKSFAADADQDAVESLVSHFKLDGDVRDALGKQTAGKFVGGSSAFAPGQIAEAAQFKGDRFIDAGDAVELADVGACSYGAWIYPKTRDSMAVLSRMDEDTDYIGYDLFLARGKVQADLVAPPARRLDPRGDQRTTSSERLASCAGDVRRFTIGQRGADLRRRRGAETFDLVRHAQPGDQGHPAPADWRARDRQPVPWAD